MIAQTSAFGSTQNSKGRTQEEIQAEYADLCGKAGDIQYRIQEHKAGLDAINQRLFTLNKEFMELKENKDKVQEIRDQMVEMEEQMENAVALEETKTP